ncbi:MAG: DUF1152 domain-containing protein [Micromonosporaceae bacterium]
MANHLYVAAGGGGDALAALLLHHTLGRAASQAFVLSYSWDRYIVDPKPGPRSVDDYLGLQPLTGRCWRVPADARLRWSAAPTLPVLAGLTDAVIALLDPHHGAAGLRAAVSELAEVTDPDTVTLVDVGGDVIATGDEAGLMSPLGDSLALAALTKLKTPVSVIVAGPGLDGELPSELVRRRCERLCTDSWGIGRNAVTAHRDVLRVHPSEATSLLAAAAVGVHGQVEVRDHGRLVAVTDESTAAYVIPHDRVLDTNRLAQQLAATTSLADAEQVVIDARGQCELTYERAKAATRAGSPTPTPAEVTERLDRYRDAARRHGASHGTLRRLCEAVGFAAYQPEVLRRLVDAHPYLPLFAI